MRLFGSYLKEDQITGYQAAASYWIPLALLIIGGSRQRKTKRIPHHVLNKSGAVHS
jgi:hypothetical protein